MNLHDRTSASIFNLRSPAAGTTSTRARRLAGAAGAGRSAMSQHWAETLEPRQMMSADLGIELNSTYAPRPFYVPGETITVPFVLRNNDISSFTNGRAVVTLSLVGTELTNTVTTNITNLAADGTLTGTVTLPLPAGFQAGNYTPRLSLALQSSTGTTIVDNSRLDNQLDLRTTDAIVRWVFGNVPATEGLAGRDGVVMTGVDPDGTEYTMAMTGGGFGEFISFAEGIVFNKLELTGAYTPNTTTRALQTVTMAFVRDTDPTEGDNSIDFNYLLGTAPQADLVAPVTLIRALTAPAVNFNRGFLLGETIGGGVNIAATDALTTVTVRNIASSTVGGVMIDQTRIFGDVAGFTAGTVDAALFISRNTGAVRLTKIDSDGSLNIGGNVVSLTIGSPVAGVGGVIATAVAHGDVLISGTVGTVSIGTIDGRGETSADPSDATLTFEKSVGAFTVGDVRTASILIGLSLPSFTARDIIRSQIALNYGNQLDNVAKPFTARNIALSVIDASLSFSTFTARSWTSSEEGIIVVPNRLVANSITTLNIGTTADATSGDFDATAYIGDRFSRLYQLGTTNITGVLSGSFLVAGSVGNFTARVVNSGTFRPATVGGGPEWAPALLASGSVLSFNSTDVRSGAVWATSLRTVNLTVASNNRSFEIVAGLKVEREAIFTVQSRDDVIYGISDLYAPAQIRSGLIDTLNITLRPASGTGPSAVPAASGFSGRFAAGFDIFQTPVSDIRDVETNLLDFSSAATASKLVTGTAASEGRINRVRVTGTIAPAAATANSLNFAATNFETTRFNYGTLLTGAGGVLLPAAPTSGTATVANPLQGAISAGAAPFNVVPALTFFRVGRPV